MTILEYVVIKNETYPNLSKKSKKIDKVGLSANAISYIARGKIRPRGKSIEILIELFDGAVSYDDIMSIYRLRTKLEKNETRKE